MTSAKILLSLLALLALASATSTSTQSSSSANLSPTIQLIILVHPYNKLLYLPYLLGSLEAQIYPKDRLRIHLLTERIFYEESYFDAVANSFDLGSDSRFEILDDRIRANDQTIEMLKLWSRQNRGQYNELELTVSNVRLNEKLFGSSGHTTNRQNLNSYWTKDRYKFLIDTKNQEMFSAFQSWCDFVLFLDADVILTEPFTFSNLTELFATHSDLVAVAPMLYSTGTYSNFWAGMDERGYYVRTEEYLPILERKKTGTWPVPMIHTAVMIDLRKRTSRELTFDPMEVEDGPKGPIPYDDIIAFAKSAEKAQIPLYIDNRQVYGFIPAPLNTDSKPDAELKQTLLELELESLIEGPSFPVSPYLESYLEPHHSPDTAGVDQIYVINLRRRPERRRRMKASMDLLGLRGLFWDATDGKTLSQEYLDRHQIRSLEGYVDPYHKRAMTFGEIGCFLSHYRIWEHAWRLNYSMIIILEDDVRFDPSFRTKWPTSLARFHALSPPFDFLYLGRKLNGDYSSEPQLDSGHFVRPGYSYWTIGYAITREGIRKLLQANPLGRMLPVDEFLPLMYGSHHNETLVSLYNNVERLQAVSLKNLLVSPTHYVGDAAYISDTEDSDKVRVDKNQPNEEMETGKGQAEESEVQAKVPQILEPQPPPAGGLSTSSYLEHLEL